MYKSTSGKKYDWSKKEINFLKRNFYKLSNKQLAKELNLSNTMLRTKCYELGLKRMDLEYWTDEQVKYLIENYKKIGDVEIAEIFDLVYPKNKSWTKKHIEKKRKYLKLKRTIEELVNIRERNKMNGRFSINHWKRWSNKISPVGTIRIWKSKSGREFKVIKTEFGFVHLAPYLWMNEFGDIPEGNIIGFKDKNSLNCVIENLMCIERSVNAIRHRTKNFDLYTEEMKESIIIISKLKKILKNG